MTGSEMARELDRLETVLRSLVEEGDFNAMLLSVAEDIKTQAVRNVMEIGRRDPRAQQVAQSLTIRKGADASGVVIVTASDYGQNWEYGTQKTPESPWFRPAVDTVLKDSRNRLQRELTVSVRTKVQRTGRPR